MSPEAKSIVYGGGGGVAVLGLATLGMIAWMFLSAQPRPNPGRAVAQNEDQPAAPVGDAPGESPGRDADVHGDAPPDSDVPAVKPSNTVTPSDVTPSVAEMPLKPANPEIVEEPEEAAPAEPESVLAEVGEMVSIPLTTDDGEPTLEIVAAPEGAELEENLLRWMPSLTDVGSHDVSVRINAGDSSHDREWTVNVRQKKLPVTFLVRGCDPSTDGSRLVVWGHDWPIGDAQISVSGNWRLAVVDLGDFSIVTEREYDEPIHQVEYCGTEVVVADTIDGLVTLRRLSADDLSEVGQGEVPGGEMTAIADQWLAVRSPGLSAEMQLRLYSLPDLEPRDDNMSIEELITSVDAFRDVLIEDYQTVYGARELADGWLLDGALWDDELRKAMLLIEPKGFLRVARNDLPEPSFTAERVLSGFVYDSVSSGSPAGGGRTRADIEAFLNRQRRGRTSTSAGGIDSPHVAATFSYRRQDEDAYVDLTDIGAEQPYQSVPLRLGPAERNYPYTDEHPIQVATTPELACVTLAGETYVIPVESRPAPFRIEPRQPDLELSGRRATRLEYVAEGAVRFELEIPALGTAEAPLRLESEEGVFRIDPVDLDQLSRSIWSAASRRGTEDVEEWLNEASEAWERFVVGRSAGVPVRIDAFVRATSEDGDIAVLKHAYVVAIPKPIFDRNQP